MDIRTPLDRMHVDDSTLHIHCPCGAMITIWYNGGELDRQTCSACNRVYWTEHGTITLRVADED